MMFEQHEDYRPVMWIGGHPYYATHCIVLFFAITMVVATLLGPIGTEGLSMKLEFDSRLVHHGQIWRVFSYGLVNPPSISFVIDMVMLFWFGREVERFFGRRIFLMLYGTLYLLTPLLFTALGFFRPLTLVGETGTLAIFIAFATLYPGAVLIFGILAKWWAIVAVAIYSLLFLYSRDFISLTSLWVTAGYAFAFVRYQQGRFTFPAVSLPSLGRKRPKLRVLPDPDSRDEDREEEDSSMPEVDALLDKIAKSGIGSLTSREREKLERARKELLRRETPRR